MTFKLPLPSEEHKHKGKVKRVKIVKKQTYNVTRDIDAVVNNISKEVGFPNYADESKIVHDDDKESDEAIKNTSLKIMLKKSRDEQKK